MVVFLLEQQFAGQILSTDSNSNGFDARAMGFISLNPPFSAFLLRTSSSKKSDFERSAPPTTGNSLGKSILNDNTKESAFSERILSPGEFSPTDLPKESIESEAFPVGTGMEFERQVTRGLSVVIKHDKELIYNVDWKVISARPELEIGVSNIKIEALKGNGRQSAPAPAQRLLTRSDWNY